MKFNMKALAVAAAMVAAGSAHADIVGAGVTATGSSVALVAWNQVTGSYYVRDLGYTLNSFLPTGAVVSAADTGAGIQADKSPEAGLTIDGTTNTAFADNGFSSWLGTQNTADIRWTVTAGDQATSTPANGQARLLLAQTGSTGVQLTNGQIRIASQAVQGLTTQNNPMGVSATGATVLPAFSGGNTILNPATSGLLGVASSLWYYTTTALTGAGTTLVNGVAYGNSAGNATLTLASNGDLSYVLAPASVAAVPIPAAAWLMGSGLMGLAGFVRRRKAAAQA